MGSSGGSSGGGYMMSPVGPPMPGLPVAGKDSNIGSPYEYGKFQNFLPEPLAEGQNPMATGLRPDMFQYRSPSGVVAESNTSGQIQSLRDELARLAAGQGQGQDNQFGAGRGDSEPDFHNFQRYLNMLNSQPATSYGGGG